jgi:hypothetical protein
MARFTVGPGRRARRPDFGEPDRGAADDIDHVVETFRQLMSKLSRDGNELGELYARAEKRAARFALLSQTVVESVSSGILVVERGGQVGLINSSAKRFLGIGETQDAIGWQLADLFTDAGSLESVVGECFRMGEDSPRNLISVVGLDGRVKKFGAGISCLKSRTGMTEAVIVVFTELGADGKHPPVRSEGGRSEIEHQGYQRGVLDAYDLLSAALAETDRIRESASRGRLAISELQQFSNDLGRTCELLMAFALSARVADALTELVDVSNSAESILKRRNLHSAPHITSNLRSGLPRVKTVGKILETGLEMLIAGCIDASPGGIDIVTGAWREGSTDMVGITVRERSMTRPVAEIGDSLRDFMQDENLRREGGLLLLRALPADSHRIKVEKLGGFLNFSIGIKVPITSKPGPGAHGGDVSERKQDGG